MKNLTKPPLGIYPRWLWVELIGLANITNEAKAQRRADVQAAIDRYEKAGLTPLRRWRIELLMCR